MSSGYIPSSYSNDEVLRHYGDRIPDFLLVWVEGLVDKANDAEELWAVIYNYSFDVDTAKEFGKALDDIYSEHAKEISRLEDEVSDLESVISKRDDEIESLEDALRTETA